MMNRSKNMKTREYMSLYGAGIAKLTSTGISKRRAKKLLRKFRSTQLK